MGMIIMNGKEYASAPKDGFPPIIYSDEEREIGVWRDGRPLYEKTVHTGAIRTSNVSVAHNIQNLKDVVYIKGYCKIDAGSFIPLPFVQGNSGATNYQVRVDVNATNVILSSVSLTDGADSYITLQYTKTTDTPGSGKYTTYGGLAHHYSENEQVVGTWIDGKPLYEKTVDCGSLLTTSSSISHGISNLKRIVSFDGNAVQDNGDLLPIPLVQWGRDVADYQVRVSANSSNIVLATTSGTVMASVIVTLRYTKTTD